MCLKISKTQYDKIINLIESGISEGATLAAGGPELPNGLNKGYFIKIGRASCRERV